MNKNIGHIHKTSHVIEYLSEHLNKTTLLSKQYCNKIDAAALGEIIGLIHDIGKADLGFTAYILHSNNMLNDDLLEYQNTYRNDHATMSGQYINQSDIPMLLKKIIANACMSHHSGLINYIPDDGTLRLSDYEKRINKDIEYDKVLLSLNDDIKCHINDLIESGVFVEEFSQTYDVIKETIVSDKDIRGRQFMLALLAKFLFSCLCDADRKATASFMNDIHLADYLPKKVNWLFMKKLFDDHIAQFENDTPINKIRGEISQKCFEMSNTDKGCTFVLNVPTGGGKTLSTLRFALNHAERNNMDRIIYVLPYTSIIEQNALVVKDILDKDGENNYVLECHSNLSVEETEKNKLLSQSFDAPIIFTTIVQFLESIYSNNIRSNRRMHNLANSIIIFDEVQCIPGKCIYMFNEFIRFITKIGKSTVLLCTATQPLLDDVPPDTNGVNRSLQFVADSHIIPADSRLSERLKRVEVIDRRKLDRWSYEEIIDLAINENAGSVLIIVNTKSCANSLYDLIKNYDDIDAVYLSTNMYPEHRKSVIHSLKEKLEGKTNKTICISTQLIEAGVDIDFDCVIRSLAGIDSIAQAAGRCNRNGRMKDYGTVYIVNPKNENLSRLQDIKRGQDTADRVLDMYKDAPEKFDRNLLGDKAINRYFQYLYADLQGSNTKYFEYIPKNSDDTLFELLSINRKNVIQYTKKNGKTFSRSMTQAFTTAGSAFNVIDSSARGVIVQHGDGRKIINELISEDNPIKISALLKQAQRYSINVFPYKFDQLFENGIYKINEDIDVCYLCDSLYDDTIGLCSGRNNLLDI